MWYFHRLYTKSLKWSKPPKFDHFKQNTQPHKIIEIHTINTSKQLWVHDTNSYTAYITKSRAFQNQQSRVNLITQSGCHFSENTIVKQLHLYIPKTLKTTQHHRNGPNLTLFTKISELPKVTIPLKSQQLTPENIYGSVAATTYPRIAKHTNLQTTHFWKLWCQNTSPVGSLRTQIATGHKIIRTTHLN